MQSRCFTHTRLCGNNSFIRTFQHEVTYKVTVLAYLFNRKAAAFQDVDVKVEPALILVFLFIGVVCVADSQINQHVPQLFHLAEQEPGDKDIQRASLVQYKSFKLQRRFWDVYISFRI